MLTLSERDAVIEIWEKALGKDHVDIARPLVALADVELQRRELPYTLSLDTASA